MLIVQTPEQQKQCMSNFSTFFFFGQVLKYSNPHEIKLVYNKERKNWFAELK